MLYIFRKLPSSWFLSSNGHVTLRLTVFEIFAVKRPNLGQRFQIWGSLGTPPPKGKRTCPGVIFTIMQNCTLIGDTVAEIFVTGQRGQRQSKPSTLPHSRMWRVINTNLRRRRQRIMITMTTTIAATTIIATTTAATTITVKFEWVDVVASTNIILLNQIRSSELTTELWSVLMISRNKKLSFRGETARCFVWLNISLSY